MKCHLFNINPACAHAGTADSSVNLLSTAGGQEMAARVLAGVVPARFEPELVETFPAASRLP